MRIAFNTALLLAAAAAAVTAHAADAPSVSTSPVALTVTFQGVETPRGSILVALYDAEGWNGGKPVRVAMVDAAGAGLTTAFAGLAAGRYGIKAFHDIDGDGKMGANPFGIPTEPFAFSNDAHGERGPASWVAAGFDVGPTGAQQRISIR